MLDADALVAPELSMKDVMSRPGIVHKFVKGLAGIPGLAMFRKSGSWQNTHADSALVEADGRKYIMVGLAHNANGGEWLVRLAPKLHALVLGTTAAKVAQR
jgi:beta-lactamase class A